MSLQPRISPVIVNTFLDLLIPLFLIAAGGDADTARAAALELLADFNPRSPRELDLATQTIGNGIRSLTMLGKSAAPGLSLADINDALKSAISLGRAGHQTQRRLDELQRLRRAAARRLQQEEDAPAELAPPPVADITRSAPADGPNEPADGAETAACPAAYATDIPDATAAEPLLLTPEQGAASVATAEQTLAKAEKLLVLMRQHVKGGTPPHSQAAQQLRDQHRLVNAARLPLAQARRRAQEAAQPVAEPAV